MKKTERYESAATTSPPGTDLKPVDVPSGRPADPPRHNRDPEPMPHPPQDPRPDG